jgi:DNA repair protein RecN (Recombination protein N)
MLQRIAVQNLAIVSQASIEFGPGLNVLTGETGAGKSILIEAIALLAGQKASSSDVRKGEPQAFVEGIVELPATSTAWDFLETSGITRNGNEVILKRIIQADGKSKAYINNQAWTVSGLSNFSQFWLDVTSQHAQQKLMNDVHHLEVVDDYAQIESQKSDYAHAFNELKKVVSEINSLEQKKLKAKEEQDYWSFQLKELENLNLQENEIETLQSAHQRSAHSHKLAEHIGRIQEYLEGESGIVPQLTQIEKELGNSSRLDASLEAVSKVVETVNAQLEDITSRIHKYSQSLNHNPVEVEKINDRLAQLQGIVRKYGDISSAIAKRDDIKKTLSLLQDGNEEEEKLHTERKKLEVHVKQKAQELTKVRKKAATDLCKKISSELQELGMKDAKIECIFDECKTEQGTFVAIDGKNFTVHGQESAYFNFSPNPGEGFRPLSTIASGGELSRILLAIKSISIQKNISNETTFLFDEVDVGIGGETADRLGIRLSALSKKGAQVLSVTHLAQIACYAQQHMRVQKSVKDKRTTTEIQLLNATERKNELARMIGGVEISDKVLAHANELLKKGVSNTASL